MTIGPDYVLLNTNDSRRLSVPASLNSISTYVILEQGCWFEREHDFLKRYLQAGMNCVDIGANVGVYATTFATRVGPTGKVYAFEPGENSRRHLSRSIAVNEIYNVFISDTAVADFCGQGLLKIDWSEELNHLVADSNSNDTESVSVTTLDSEAHQGVWPAIDLVKIDAEGQEAAVLAGGKEFFTAHSPLVMFEYRQGDDCNEELIAAFSALGYDCYRLLGDGSMLVPMSSSSDLDAMDLNLFSVRPERAENMRQTGLLAAGARVSSLSQQDELLAVKGYLSLPLATAFDICAEDVSACPFREALVLYSAYRFLPNLGTEVRFGFLQTAASIMHSYCMEHPCAASLSTLARIQHDLGRRKAAVETMDRIVRNNTWNIAFPFYPVMQEFEVNVDASSETWFGQAISEYLERFLAHSTLFSGVTPRLRWLADHESGDGPFTRRLLLAELLARQPAETIRPYIDKIAGVASQDKSVGAWLSTVRTLAKRW